MSALPPQLPVIKTRTGPKRLLVPGIRGIIVLLIAATVLLLRGFDLLRPFKIPTASMAPAVSAGDHVFMEGISYKFRSPSRGDMVVFQADGIPMQPSGTLFIKRVIGEPGDELRIIAEKLYVNGKQVTLSNELGPIRFQSVVGARYLTNPNDALKVSAGEYFVIGDNTRNSADSRYWGAIPAKDIKGRVFLCYWPLQRVGIHR